MKTIRPLRVKAAIIGLILFSMVLNAEIESNLVSLKKEMDLLELPSVQLNFTNILETQNTKAELTYQLKQLQKAIILSETIKTEDICELIEFEKIKFDLKLHQLRLNLLIENNDEKYKGRVYSLPNHEQWYQLLTQWWLGSDISVDELKRIGEQEFKRAHQQLLIIKNKEKDKFTSSENVLIIKEAYREAEMKTMKSLYKLFPTHYKFKPAKLMRSNLGMSFPAPGYYNLENETFYYNPLSDSYNLSQVDWLYIHEAIPGHHYQKKIADDYGICRNHLNSESEMAFTEGWAAYAETLGQDLGLFDDANSLYFALKWQALRAMRVIIDVGLHAEGWSVNQAKDYWQKNFPEGLDVMNREIQRIQDWPMQVNTYVYGKYKIEQLKRHLRTEESFNEIEFHKNVLSLTHLPLITLNYYSQIFK